MPRRTDDELLAIARQYDTIRDWKKNDKAAQLTAWRRGEDFYAKCTARMTRLQRADGEGYTLEECMSSALRYRTRTEWQHGDHNTYCYAHRTDDWFDQCVAHMEPPKMGPEEVWTLNACEQDALKYKTKADWGRGSKSAYIKAWKMGWLEDCCAHMERVSTHDNDALYLWEWVEDGKGVGIYKPGVTSWRLGDQRIREVATVNGLDYRLIALCETSEGDALMFEKALLDMGEKPALPDHITDGRTEFRIYSDEELEFIYQLMGVEEHALAEAA